MAIQGSLAPAASRSLAARTAMMVSALGMALFAAYLYHGVLNPLNVLWIANEGDSFQHYIGWDFFRDEPWSWPLGTLDSLATEVHTSIVYTDSIPLYAIPLKLVGQWLPESFQYLGLAVLVNFVLNGVFGCRLLIRLGMPAASAAVLAIMISTLPSVTMRGLAAHGHEALTAHWVLFLALEYLLCFGRARLADALKWMALLVVAVLLHFYLFFMAGAIWVAWLAKVSFTHVRERGYGRLGGLSSRWLAVVSLTPVLVALVMWAAGYFTLGVQSASAGGYQFYSAELLSFFNPKLTSWSSEGHPEDHWKGLSSFMAGWTPYRAGQVEGVAYAGVGIFLLWAVALATRFWGCPQGKLIPGMSGTLFWPLLVALGFFLYAMGGVLSLGSQWEVPLYYERLFGPLTGILRASGRMSWLPLYLLIIVAAFAALRRLGGRGLLGVLLVAAVLQFIDLERWNSGTRGEVFRRLAAAENPADMYSLWNDPDAMAAIRQRGRVVMLSMPDLMAMRPYVWAASEYGASLNVAYFARLDHALMERLAEPYRAAMASGWLPRDAVYVLSEASDIRAVCDDRGWICRRHDGLVVGWYQEGR